MSALSVRVQHADGSTSRWGSDEPDASGVPQNISFSTAIPSGFKDCSLELARRIDVDYPDLNLLDTITILGPGNEVAWEGRIVQLPRSHGDSVSIQVGAVGWAAHLRDDPSFTEVYVDSDLSQWKVAGTGRQLELLAGSVRLQNNVELTSGAIDGEAALAVTMVGTWNGQSRALAVFDAGRGNTIASAYFEWEESAAIGVTDTNWIGHLTVVDSDGAVTNSESSADLISSTPTRTGTFSPTARHRFLEAWHQYAITGGTDQVQYTMFWKRLKVYCDHGLTKRGTEPDVGFYASDVIADILSRAAPKLSYTTGEGGSIEATDYAIPHLVFKEPTTAEEAILATNKYHLYEWGVWENRRFFYRAPNPDRLTWATRLDRGAHLDLEGDQADDLYSGVVVTYPHFDGTTKTVGPPGSGADAEDATLEDTDPGNPVVAHGLRRWHSLNVSEATDQAGATSIGYVWLQEHKLPQRRGTLIVRPTFHGDIPMIEHPTAGMRPVWAVRAGDYCKVQDHPASDARRIIETRYDNDSQTLTLSLDNTVFKLEALLERLGVGLVGA